VQCRDNLHYLWSGILGSEPLLDN